MKMQKIGRNEAVRSRRISVPTKQCKQHPSKSTGRSHKAKAKANDVMSDQPGSTTRSSMISEFDYDWPAELFVRLKRSGRRSPLTHKRFPTASAAIEYASVELPPSALADVVMEIDEQRYGPEEIAALHRHHPASTR